MGFDVISAVKGEFALICEEITLAELFGNPELWATIYRIEELLA